MDKYTPELILDFWFNELKEEDYWTANQKVDEVIRQRFADVHQLAVDGELKAWRATTAGRLAEIIVLDQFSRNLFRGDKRAFAADTLALQLAKEAVAKGLDQTLPASHQLFLYMPYMHSEDPRVHVEAVTLFSQPGLEKNLEYEFLHKKIIDRFGRYPHRNDVLGRASTPEEVAFLKEPNSSF